MDILVKNGTGNYSEYDGCDFLVKRIENDKFPIPRIGETIQILEDNDEKQTNSNGVIFQEYHDYLVRDVVYWVADNNYGVNVYVIPIGRSVK